MWLTLFLNCLPTVLSIINKLLSKAHDNQMIDAGKAEAFAQQLGETSRIVNMARATEAAAAAAHAKDPTDAAFDQDFKREDEP